ncbi:MAG: carboxypeptidase [Bacteroidetes bacterium]|nr:carboxypeptidase [Bacteroidota bacterium]MCL5737516.1 carboxypeptidase [Bacteroidota bacterium]
MRMHKFYLLVLLALLVNFTSLSAQPKPEKGDSTEAAEPKVPKPVQIVTHHSITINGQMIRYTATTGTLLLKDENDKPIALFGFTAYTKDGVTDPSTRPITFAYNGGPGSSSIWLHMGAVGPKRVVIDDPEATPPAPYKIEDNPYSLLDVTDLVMVDPVGTGFSRPVGKAKGADFWGVDQDIKSVSEFIFQYIRANDRWNSPKFLLGESYGTTRSAGVADYLYEKMGIAVNGVVFVSTVFNFETLAFAPGNDLPYILYLPTYAAVAWYHHVLPSQPADMESFLQNVRKFAKGEYADALFKGAATDSTEFRNVVDKLYKYTGISKSYWMKANLRVSEPQFTDELLREHGLTVGRLDARYEGPTADLLSEYASYDPQSSTISPVFITDFLNYLHTDLKFPTDETYHIAAYGNKDFKWEWKQQGRGEFHFQMPNVSPNLADVMAKDPYLNILVLNGYFDLATPFFATEYTMDHLGNNIPDLKNRIHMKYFKAGHMMYIRSESLPTFKSDITHFMESMIHPKK